MPSILATAMARQEGYGVSGSVAQRNNNPGNLMSPPGGTWAGQVGVDSKGFAVFSSADAGWTALDKDISANADLSLSQFIAKYAPSSENNTAAYIANVSNWTGADPNQSVADIVAGNVPTVATDMTPDLSTVSTAGLDLSGLGNWWQSLADSWGVDPTLLGVGAALVGVGLVWMAARD